MTQFVLFINCLPFQLFIQKHIASRRLRWIMRGRSAGKSLVVSVATPLWIRFFFFPLQELHAASAPGLLFPDSLSLPTTPLWCGGMQIRSASACETRPEPQTEPTTPPASPRRHPAEVLQAPSSPSTPPCLGGWQTLQHVEWRAVAREEALRFATFHLVVSFAECSIIPVRPPAAQSASQTVELLSPAWPWLGCKCYRVICLSTVTHQSQVIGLQTSICMLCYFVLNTPQQINEGKKTHN